MTSLWKIDFEKIRQKKEKSPVELLNEQCQALSALSQDKVKATLYDCDTEDLKLKNMICSHEVSGFNPDDIDYYIYDFSITSHVTHKYSYHVFYMYFCMDFYPTKIIVNDEIAKELNISDNCIVVNNKDELVSAFKNIFNCNAVSEVIKKLYLLNLG